MKRHGSAEWLGGLQDGKGTVTTESMVLENIPYSFKTRFGDGTHGTNPEELIAIAHAGCFSMAFAAQLEKAGLKAERIQTTAAVSLEQADGGFSIPAIHLNVIARVPGADLDTFNKIAKEAKEGCPVSKLMKATISMDAVLEN